MILPNSQLAMQFKELEDLQDGWLDGGGTALDKTGLAWLEKLFVEQYARDLPVPTFFPTPESNVRIEWAIGRNDISLEVDLEDRTGYLHAMNLDSGADEEATLHLQTKEEWAKLFTAIRAHIA